MNNQIKSSSFPRKPLFEVQFLMTSDSHLQRGGYHEIKEIPNGFPCLDNVIQTRVTLFDFRKARLVLLVFRKSSNIRSVWIPK